MHLKSAYKMHWSFRYKNSIIIMWKSKYQWPVYLRICRVSHDRSIHPKRALSLQNIAVNEQNQLYDLEWQDELNV